MDQFSLFQLVLIVDEVTFDNLMKRFVFESRHKLDIPYNIMNRHVLPNFHPEKPFSNFYFDEEKKFKIIDLSLLTGLGSFVKTKGRYISIRVCTFVWLEITHPFDFS